jgi:hypothetical protein
MKICSKLYMEQEDETWSARPTRRVVRDLHADEDSCRWIAVVGSTHIAVGDPVDGDDECLYLPQWLMDCAGLISTEDYEVEFKRSEDFPKATKISLKILGDIPGDLDIKDLLEEPLSQLGLIEVGQIIPAPVLEGVCLLVQECEPAGGAVFLDGEAALEIETDGVLAEGAAAAAAPPAAEPFEDEPEVFSAPVPWRPFQGVGRRLCD